MPSDPSKVFEMLRRLVRRSTSRSDLPVEDRPSKGRPIDLVHLARQTLGDRELEREILQLMACQVESCDARIDLATAAERRSLAHAIKGAARNVGAFALGDAAEAVEEEPADDGRLPAMKAELRRAGSFIRTLLG